MALDGLGFRTGEGKDAGLGSHRIVNPCPGLGNTVHPSLPAVLQRAPPNATSSGPQPKRDPRKSDRREEQRSLRRSLRAKLQHLLGERTTWLQCPHLNRKDDDADHNDVDGKDGDDANDDGIMVILMTLRM